MSSYFYRKNKKKLAQLYKQNWGVRVKSIDSYTPEKLEEILSKKATKKQQTKAVIKIQTIVRGNKNNTDL